MMEELKPQHTSYADEVSASDDYAARFAGPVGTWMLAQQASLTLKLLTNFSKPQSILDVGGGHGQLALPLSRQQFDVTVIGSSELALRQVKLFDRSTQIRCLKADLLHTGLESGSFDVVLCFRLLPHIEQWQALIAELTRLTRYGVIVDYPTSSSLNVLSPLLFGAKKGFEKNTRPYALFRPAEIRAAFAQHNFVSKACLREFALPMVLHRMLKSPNLSAVLEDLARRSSATALLGSPIIELFVPDRHPKRA